MIVELIWNCFYMISLILIIKASNFIITALGNLLFSGSFYSSETKTINQPSPCKEINILILGETGVGKSTWINGFQNYLTYSTLKEAEEHDLCSLIPSQFTICDKNFEEITISTGTDKNEVQNIGHSSTQKSKVYSFVFGDTTIRLIDTPGIGDTRGIDQDNINFENILSTLSYLNELHGICILLKPNNSRLTLMFKFCIKELLTYLHKDASKNIVFCFTNSRGTFYRPGDTMPLLKELLKKNKNAIIPITRETVYCFDSEAYRFLAAIKNKTHPVIFPMEEHDNFSQSWQRSIFETKRMLENISKLPPHKIQNTLSLNNARNLVQKLTRPMAEIIKNIQTNKEILKDNINEIQMTKTSISNLQKKKTFKKLELEVIPIDYPKTVCANISCKSIYGQGNYMQISYTSMCHEHCYLTGVNHDTIGDENLLGCACMKKGMCSKCTHSYREHLHIYYDSKEVEKDVEDVDVANILKSKLSETEKKQKVIELKNAEILELDIELNKIQEASVKFACFLKHNAITPYNDEMLNYLNYLIQEERDKVSLGGNDSTLMSLKTHLESYKKKIEILSNEMEKSNADSCIPKVADISLLIKNLYKLKHSGKHLQKSLNAERTVEKYALNQKVFPNKLLQTSNMQFLFSNGAAQSRKNFQQNLTYFNNKQQNLTYFNKTTFFNCSYCAICMIM